MVCYENRNGLVMAYDVESRSILVPGEGFRGRDPGERFDPFSCDFGPEAIAEELRRLGVAEVVVFAGPGASWVNGQIRDWPSRVGKFLHMASQAVRHRGAWTPVAVTRIDDGTDWEDIYGPWKSRGTEG